MLKDALDDYARHQDDFAQNSKLSLVLNKTTGSYDDMPWRNIVIGDIVELHPDEEIPADCLILAAQEGDKEAELAPGDIPPTSVKVDTAQLDGETNLKVYQAWPECYELRKINCQMDAKMTICVDAPNSKIYNLAGKLSVEGITDQEKDSSGNRVNKPLSLTKVRRRS